MVKADYPIGQLNLQLKCFFGIEVPSMQKAVSHMADYNSRMQHNTNNGVTCTWLHIKGNLACLPSQIVDK